MNSIDSTDLRATGSIPRDEKRAITTQEIIELLTPEWKKLFLISIGTGIVAFGLASLIPPTYTAKATFVSPQQQQNSAAAALASLGAIGSLAGISGAIKSPADQYIALMESTTISNRIIDRFKLIDLYEAKYRVDAQKTLANSVKISAGKKDTLITVEVDDHSPQRAADIANAYIQELKELSDSLALTEAKQRRIFFEGQLKKTRDNLTAAQLALQSAGVNQGTFKIEPRSAVEAYAKLKAEISSNEIRLNALESTRTQGTPEVQQQIAVLEAEKQQLAKIEQPPSKPSDTDYADAYRELKYQESLFEIFSKQFEIAKLDESRDETLFQIIDPATPPEKKSKPKRSIVLLLATFMGFACSSIYFIRKKHGRGQAQTN